MSASFGRDRARAIEVIGVVLLARLHPCGGRAVPQPNHVVQAWSGVGRAGRPDGVEQHAPDFPMGRELTDVEGHPVGRLDADRLRSTEGAPSHRLGAAGHEHRDIGVQERSASQHEVVVATEAGCGRDRRQSHQIGVERTCSANLDARGMRQAAGRRAGQDSHLRKLQRRVPDRLRALLVLGLDAEARLSRIARSTARSRSRRTTTSGYRAPTTRRRAAPPRRSSPARGSGRP